MSGFGIWNVFCLRAEILFYSLFQVLDDAYLNWITLRTNAYTISAWPIEEEEGMAILAQLPAAVLVVEVFTHLEPVPIIYAWCRIFSTRIWEAWKATFTSSLSA